MTMASATLSTQLQAISGATEAAAITSWVNAWETYFLGAQTSAAPVRPYVPGAAPKNAMAAAMVGLSVSGQALAKIQAGIIAWWGVLVAAPATYFATTTSVTAPSGLSSIAADLGPIALDNVNNSRSSSFACNAIAAAIHTRNLTGAATNLGPIT